MHSLVKKMKIELSNCRKKCVGIVCEKSILMIDAVIQRCCCIWNLYFKKSLLAYFARFDDFSKQLYPRTLSTRTQKSDDFCRSLILMQSEKMVRIMHAYKAFHLICGL